MTTALRAQARKEFRQLLPWWGAIAGAMVAMAIAQAMSDMPTFSIGAPGLFPLIGSLIYAAGAVALGALMLGHEYSNRTLSAMLLQPIPRGWVLVVKLAVLAVMLALLQGVAVLATGLDLNPNRGFPRSTVLAWLPIACSLSLAPLLTMVCRGTLAGAVLSWALILALFPAGAYFGVPHTAIGSIIVVLTALSAALMWRTFLRLEVVGGPQTEVDLLGRFHRRTEVADGFVVGARRHHPIWLLVRKELRIQQPTFAVSALFVLLWLMATGARAGTSGELPEETLYIAAGLHVGLVALLTGALASAEERRFRTADWHQLLPVPAWTQWTVKSGIVVSMSIGLTVGLPSLMMRLAPDPGLESAGIPPPGLILVVCLAALYVSSLSTSGVHALLATPPVIGAAILVLLTMAWPTFAAVGTVGRWFSEVLPGDWLMTMDDYQWWMLSGVYWLAASVSVPLFHFGFVNHSRADRGRRIIVRQMGWFGAYGLFAVVVYSLMLALVAGWIYAGG